MALAGYDNVIPLDQTIKAMYDIALKLPLNFAVRSEDSAKRKLPCR